MLIQPYDPNWSNQFNCIKVVLWNALSGIKVSIEHVGSTSVQNLSAKPIIDIDVVYFDKTDFELIKINLEKIGYFHVGNQDVEGREVFKRKGLNYNEVLNTISHHLYVCKNDCAELYRHLSFRDYLRNNNSARSFYENLKLQIADEANQDRKQYAHLKELKATSFINYIISISKTENSY